MQLVDDNTSLACKHTWMAISQWQGKLDNGSHVDERPSMASELCS